MGRIKNKSLSEVDMLKQEISHLSNQIEILLDDLENKQILVDKYSHRENQLRAILNSSKQAYILMDPGGNILDFNKLANQNAKCLVGSDMHTGRNIMEYVLDQDQQKFEEYLNKALDGENARFNTFQPGLNDESMYYSLCFSPVHHDDGRVIGILYCAIDITEQKCMELALRDTNNDLHDLIDMIDCDVFFARIDTEGRVLRSYLSQGIKDTTGYKRDYFLRNYNNFLNIIHEEDLMMVKDHYFRLLQGDIDFVESDFRIIRENGEIIQLSGKLGVKRFPNKTMQITVIIKKKA